MLKRLACRMPDPKTRTCTRRISFNASSLLIIGSSRCSVRQVMDGSLPDDRIELTSSSVVRRVSMTRPTQRHPLILDGLCLHVLSSFQRTGIPQRLSAPGRERSLADRLPSGEPFDLTKRPRPCQPSQGFFPAELPSRGGR
jgi:hypothetical protein